MLVSKDLDQGKPTAEHAPELHTEGPLCEKDQQGQAIERSRKLAEKALAQWRRLREKVEMPLKK